MPDAFPASPHPDRSFHSRLTLPSREGETAHVAPLGYYHKRSILRAKIGTDLAAAVAVDADLGDVADMADALIDEARQVLQGRQPDGFDPVEKLVVEHGLDLAQAPCQQAEIDHH